MNLRESFISKFAASYVKPRFEIWFAAILIPENDQAFWVRYSTLNPRNNRDLYSTGAVWVSLFDRKNPKITELLHSLFLTKTFQLGKIRSNFQKLQWGRII